MSLTTATSVPIATAAAAAAAAAADDSMINSTFFQIVSVVATVITIGMYVANSVPLRAMWTSQQWGAQKPSGIYGVLIGTTWWLSYGVILGLPSMWLNSIFGWSVGVFGAVTFAKFAATPEDQRAVMRTAGVIVFGSVTIIAFICSGLLIESASAQRNTLGLCAASSSVLMFGAPLSGAAAIIRTQDASRLSPLVLAMSLAVCGIWTLYGLLLNDWLITIPNGGGGLITSLLIVLLIKYGRKGPGAAMTVEADTLPISETVGAEPPCTATDLYAIQCAPPSTENHLFPIALTCASSVAAPMMPPSVEMTLLGTAVSDSPQMHADVTSSSFAANGNGDGSVAVITLAPPACDIGAAFHAVPTAAAIATAEDIAAAAVFMHADHPAYEAPEPVPVTPSAAPAPAADVEPIEAATAAKIEAMDAALGTGKPEWIAEATNDDGASSSSSTADDVHLV